MDASKKIEILLIDDNQKDIDLLVSAIEPDYQMVVARDGESAIAMSGSFTPDLILLDVELPGINGFEVCKMLKKNAVTQNIPVIFITSQNSVEDQTKGLELGAIDYIFKPICMPIVRARIKNHLNLKRLLGHESDSLDLIRLEKEKADNLLSKILPAAVAKQLKENKTTIAQSYNDATVLFADIVGFTELSAKLPAAALVQFLNEIFSSFDLLTEKYGLEKIKTIGDAYMVVGGIPSLSENHFLAVAEMALDMMEEISRFTQLNSHPLQIRIGVNTGQVMAGVIGVKKFIFDLWGDTVNIASRMESQGVPGKIQVTMPTYHRLSPYYEFEKRGAIYVKGRGEMETYFLIGKKNSQLAQTFQKELDEQGQASLGFKRAEEELKTLSLCDELTGLFSRNGFVALVRHTLAVAKRENRHALLLLIRVDNLEAIMKTAGSEHSDQALKTVAQMLYKTFRISDLVGRIGENLFLIFGLEVTKTDQNILSTRFEKTFYDYTPQIPLHFPLKLSFTETKWDPNKSLSLNDLLKEMECRLAPKLLRSDFSAPES